MNRLSSTKIFQKIENLEKEVQKLKLETFFVLPPRKQISVYPEKSLLKAIQQTRKSIWQERYAKKM